jgi:hypothetical protein
MAYSWNSRGRPAGVAVEEIDLTLSDSPEAPSPPLRPRSTPRSPIKFVPKRPTLPARVKLETAAAPGPSRTQAKQPAPKISLSHVAGIVNTTDEHILRQVVLNLCKTSPALSGALVRGLSPHSSFAQNLIRRHTRGNSQRPQRPQVKVERQVKAERETSLSGRSDSPINIMSSPDFTHFIKKDRNASPMQSDGSSSTAFSNPHPTAFQRTPVRDRGPSSLSNPPVRPPEQPVRNVPTTPSASSSQRDLLNNPHRPSVAQTERKPEFKICRNCGHQFLEGVRDTCFYHPGRKQTKTDITGRRTTQYSCCDGQEWEAPCEMGTHVAPIVSGLDVLKQSRSHLQDRASKRPKLL